MAKEKAEKLARLDLKNQDVVGIIAQVNKKYGENTLVLASDATGLHLKFISTGVYALDFAIGGGIPENRITELRGNFSTLKSTVCNKAIANFQRKYPDGLAFFEDGEKSFDPVYAQLVGVDPHRVVIINADSGEQAVDVMAELINLGRHVFIVLDSIATLVPTKELESSMDQNFQGLHPRLVNRMLRVLSGGMKRSMYDSTAGSTTILATNQMREKIGVVYGDPTTSPGGKGREHYCSLMIKFLSSPSDRVMEKITKNGIEREIRVAQKVRFNVTKNKVSGSQFEEGEFVYYVKPYDGRLPYTVNNEDVLFRMGVFYGVIRVNPPAGKRKRESYSFDEFVNRDETRFQRGLIDNAKVARRLYRKVMKAIIDEKEEGSTVSLKAAE